MRTIFSLKPRTSFWAVIVLSAVLLNQNCGPGFTTVPHEASSLGIKGEPVCLEGDTQSGYPSMSALFPSICGPMLTRRCVNGVWDIPESLSSTCDQYCIHPLNHTPQLAGFSFISFTKKNGTTQEACDEARRISVCDSSSGRFSPAPAAYSNCLVSGQVCAYSEAPKRATPTGRSAGDTVTGYSQSSATFPNLCGNIATRTCQTSGQWNGPVPLYHTCQQNCLNPDTGSPVPAGTAYKSYYTRSSGTGTECENAFVYEGASTCDSSTGQFSPALPKNRYSSCTVINTNDSFTCDLLSNTSVYSVPPLKKPGYLQTVTDPIFNTKITRITGDPGTAILSGGVWGKDVHHQYSKMQAWNADQSLIFIETNRDGNGSGSVFLDGSNYQPVFSRGCPGTECRWHPTNPNVMIYVSGNKIGEWNPRADTTTVISTFSGYSDFHIGPWEGNLSLDGSMMAINGSNPKGKEIVFAYSLSSKKKYGDILVSSFGDTLDWVSISPNGKYIVLQVDDDVTNILTLAGKKVVEFQQGHPSHFDMTLDENGDEVAIGKAVNGAPYDGRIIKVRLKDGMMSPLTKGGYGRHTSTRDTAAKSWAASSMEAVTTYPPYDAEIVLSHVGGSVVYRLAHHRSHYVDYETEVIPTLSPDGMHILFASNWGAASGRPMQVYVIDLTDKCHYK